MEETLYEGYCVNQENSVTLRTGTYGLRTPRSEVHDSQSSRARAPED